MFPGAGAQIYYNEAGEVIGWDYPSTDPSDFYCNDCGYNHIGRCDDEEGNDEE